MGNDHIGLAALMLHKGLHQFCFKQGIHIARWLVEEHEAGTAQERTCNGYTLALPVRQLRTVAAELCIQAVRQLVNEIIQAGMMRGLHDAVFRGIRVCDGDIVTEC